MREGCRRFRALPLGFGCSPAPDVRGIVAVIVDRHDKPLVGRLRNAAPASAAGSPRHQHQRCPGLPGRTRCTAISSHLAGARRPGPQVGDSSAAFGRRRRRALARGHRADHIQELAACRGETAPAAAEERGGRIAPSGAVALMPKSDRAFSSAREGRARAAGRVGGAPACRAEASMLRRRRGERQSGGSCGL